MRHRWGICGEELVVAIVMSVVFAGWLGAGAEKVMASRIERASFSAGPAVSASLVLGAHRVPGMMTAGWSVCWRGAGRVDRTCFNIEVAWGLAVQAHALRAEDLASCVGARCDQLKMKSQ